MMSCHNAFRFVLLLVSMTTRVLGNTRASVVCGDDTGFNCLYQTNAHELQDIPVQFDNPLPSWLIGTLIRNGLGMFEREKQSVTHVFDGFAKLSSWRFLPNGTTFFSTRFIRSNFYKESKAQDHLAPYMLFNTPDPPFSFAERQKSMLQGIDNMNINIWDFPESQGDPAFIALSDYWSVYDISGRDLGTNGLIKPKLTGGESLVHMNIVSSGHPLPEPGTTNRLTFLVRQKMMKFLNNRLSLVRMSSVSGRSLIAEWKVREEIPYMHSFAVTQTKAVMVTGPVVTDNINCLFKNAAALPCMRWHEDKPSILYIVDLKSGKKKTIKMTSSLFAIHHINAYDVGDDEIIMDVVCYDSMDIVTKMVLLDTMLNEEKRNDAYSRPMIRRVFINLSSKTANVQDMSTDNPVTDGFDMPAINENYRSQKYCYAYGMNNFADGQRTASEAILKKDMCNGGAVVGKLLIENHYPAEPAFVPNPTGTAEDDGVLLVPFLRGPDAVTYLAVVDAKTMTITSKADLPTYLPFSLHGKFVHDFY